MAAPLIQRISRNSDEAPDARVVVLPHAGGAVSAYVPLARRLPPRVEVVAAQYPGRQNRIDAPAATSLTSLAEDVAGEVLELRPQVPLVVLGHSLGATLGYEVATRLGVGQVQAFVASGRGAPHVVIGETRSWLDDHRLVESLSSLGGPEAAAYAHAEISRMSLPYLRADLSLLDRYRCREPRPIGCPVIVLAGRADDACSDADLRAWSELCADGMAIVHRVPGGHHHLLEDAKPTVEVLTALASRPSEDEVLPRGCLGS